MTDDPHLAVEEPFISQLARLVREERTTGKWVFVPYPSLKWTLSERLLHGGCSWANLRFVTPFEVALELAAPFLLSKGINPKPETLGPSLIQKLLVGLPGRVPQYFRPLVDQPGMAETLWGTLRELRMAGIRSGHLTRLPSTPKRAELKALLRSYEGCLETHRIADRAAVLLEAVSQVERAPVKEWEWVLEMPSALWAPLERKLLDELPGRRLPAEVPDLPAPRRLSLLCPGRKTIPQDVLADSGLLRHLLAPVEAPPPRRDGSLRLFSAGRRDSEIQEVLRRVLGDRLAADSIEIAAGDSENLPLLRDQLLQCDLPATLEPGLPIAASRPGQALLCLLSWIEHRYTAFDLRHLLLSGLLFLRGRSVDSRTAARLLEQSGATWERETYFRTLGNLRSWFEQRAQATDEEPDRREGLDRQARETAELAEWVSTLFRRLPAPDPAGLVEWTTWVRGLRSILENEVPVGNDDDRAARLRIFRALDELLLLESQRSTVEDCLRLLRDKLAPLRFGGSRALPGHVHVTTLDRVGLTGRSNIFLLGLEEGRLFQGELEDPVLTDEERERLHPGLARSPDRPSEAVFLVLERLAALGGKRVTLSYSTRELRSGQELLPSWVFFHAARLLEPAIESHGQLFEWLGEPVGYAPGTPRTASTEMAWWLARLPVAGPDRQKAVLETFPGLAAGRQAELARQTDLFTMFDGWVPNAAGRLDPRRTGLAVSCASSRRRRIGSPSDSRSDLDWRTCTESRWPVRTR
ncbi:MAG: hypothetical protein HY319_26340 [Armatimonadetes bacterium]|nr:hypothetical protein [Armatimonadota bacterium]